MPTPTTATILTDQTYEMLFGETMEDDSNPVCLFAGETYELTGRALPGLTEIYIPDADEPMLWIENQYVTFNY